MPMELKGTLARGMERALWVLPGTLKHHWQHRTAASMSAAMFFKVGAKCCQSHTLLRRRNARSSSTRA